MKDKLLNNNNTLLIILYYLNIFVYNNTKFTYQLVNYYSIK